MYCVIRAAWDDNPNWVLNAENKLKEQLCYENEDDFESTLKSMGFIARILAVVRTRRLRELNTLMEKRLDTD